MSADTDSRRQPSKWRSPTAFLIVVLVSGGYVLHYVNPGFQAPAELIPLALLAAGYLFGVDYENLVKKKNGKTNDE